VDDLWYCVEPGGTEASAPKSTAELEQAVASGVISSKSRVCRVGETAWSPIAEVAPFAAAITAREGGDSLLEVEPDPEPAQAPNPGRASASILMVPSAPEEPIGPLTSTLGPLPAVVPPPRAGGSSAPRPASTLPFATPPAYAKMHSSIPPVGETVPAAPQPKSTFPRWAMLASGLVAAVITLGVGIGLAKGFGSRESRLRTAIVRVTTPSGFGTGFFVSGPDDQLYVATAYHVIAAGDPVLIERSIEVGDKRSYVEAYPEAEVVGFDADADVAILRVKNVVGGRFERFTLANEPVKDAKVASYGYPGSSLAKRAGLVSKDGKILSLVKFPVIDRRYGRVVRDNAVDGLLVSTDIEPGFSGGPTCNELGEVVGINVTKDRAHVGQNGVVSVALLKQLMGTVKPAKDQANPKPEDVTALLKRIQSDVLMLPLDQRTNVREADYLAGSELPALRRLVGEVRRQERNTDPTFVPKLHLSGQAALGIFFSRLPGKQLETYFAPSTRSALSGCELSNQRLASFLEGLGGTKTDASDGGLHESCDELADRPLAWDLTAATLQWDGKEKEYTVTKIEKVDEEGAAYRAQVRIGGAPTLVDIWIAQEQGRLGLKLFDNSENLYAIKSPRSVEASALGGAWVAKGTRVADPSDRNVDMVTDEHVSISVQGNAVSVRHTLNQQFFVSETKKATRFRCSGHGTIDTGLLQSFAGTLDNGVVLAVPTKDAERIGADGASCLPKYQADKVISLKMVGDKLVMTRTNGINYPESQVLTKE
jgi:S1-C subfamily serine protease